MTRASPSHTATYSSYGLIMKQVWVKSAACAATAAATSGALAPTDVTAMPAPRSIRTLPSTSSMTAPAARDTYTGSVDDTPAATAARRRSPRASERGPGIAVRRTRRCSRGLTGAETVVMGGR